MHRTMTVRLTYPTSAPFPRMAAELLALAKGSINMRPLIELPDYDEDDHEQVALFNHLRQYGVPVRVPSPPTTANAEAAEDARALAELQDGWDRARAAGTEAAEQAAQAETPDSTTTE